MPTEETASMTDSTQADIKKCSKVRILSKILASNLLGSRTTTPSITPNVIKNYLQRKRRTRSPGSDDMALTDP